jgi:hypothetical protein
MRQDFRSAFYHVDAVSMGACIRKQTSVHRFTMETILRWDDGCMLYTGCFKIDEFRIQSVVGKDPLRKKIALPEEDISTLILFNS